MVFLVDWVLDRMYLCRVLSVNGVGLVQMSSQQIVQSGFLSHYPLSSLLLLEMKICLEDATILKPILS